MIYSLLTPFAHRTPVNYNDTLFP
jgi:hypothetical protein